MAKDLPLPDLKLLNNEDARNEIMKVVQFLTNDYNKGMHGFDSIVEINVLFKDPNFPAESRTTR